MEYNHMVNVAYVRKIISWQRERERERERNIITAINKVMLLFTENYKINSSLVEYNHMVNVAYVRKIISWQRERERENIATAIAKVMLLFM